MWWLPISVSVETVTQHVWLSSLPHVGQNLWFFLDSADDIRSLLENLHPRGVRESALKEELKKNLDAVIKSVSSTLARYGMVLH